MKLGVFTVLFSGQPFDKALDYIKKSGLEAVEIGVGSWPGSAHCPVNDLLASKDKVAEYKRKITGRGLEISALSCHGNPLHPSAAFAKSEIDTMHKAFRLAEMLGVGTVITFSGCPGGGPKDTVPNWVTCSWPPDFAEAVKWQWEEKVIPFWKKEAKVARTTASGWPSRCIRASASITPTRCCGSARRPARTSAPTSTRRTSFGRGWIRW
jgi:sugar phosphate isomerase/epimerase